MKLKRNPWSAKDATRFQVFEAATPKEVLEDLINLPGERGTKEAMQAAIEFLKLRGPLRKGYESAENILMFRESFRSFWRIDEWPPGAREFGLETKGTVLCHILNSWPHSDARIGVELMQGSWAVNWKTGTVFIRALDPLAVLAHTVFINRERLRKCKNPECGRLFISETPRGDYCSRQECKSWASRTRHNRSYHKRKGKKSPKGGRR